jgi:ribose transport system permease protein
MTKKKKSILSDQRFIVLLVIIVLFAVFSFKSREFRQYTTILSMLDFSYYDLLMAIGVTFPLITGGVDLSIGTGMVCYALIAGSLVRNNNLPVALAMLLCIWNHCRSSKWCADRYYESAAIPCNTLYMYDYPRCRILM